ncbi:MAG TPA: DUF4007 family protein [Puia sp.]|jgi:hypothetical protein|nr:DUF4007 family protein [Puia sp.]
MKLQFSGHESFICKHFWLKKGYDFISQEGDFNAESAVVDLGVGRNMVISISYWLKAFGILEAEGTISELGNYLFHPQTGVDPYIENLGTVWLLHYSLINTQKASIYSLFFNEFRRGREAFTKAQLQTFIKRKLEDGQQKSFSGNTVNSDISVFIRNYLRPVYKETKIDVEEDFTGLLIDLDLMKTYTSKDADDKLVDWYQVESKLQVDLPSVVVLFSILDNPAYGNSIAFKELLTGNNSPGAIFALNEAGLFSKITAIVEKYKGITYTETAGVRELQFRNKPNKWTLLNGYFKD